MDYQAGPAVITGVLKSGAKEKTESTGDMKTDEAEKDVGKRSPAKECRLSQNLER